MTTNWNAETVDYVVECLLAQDSQRAFDHECARLAKQLEIGAADVRVADKTVRDGDPVRRFFWGLCVRVREYDQVAARQTREGPLTWTERKALQWASTGKSDFQKGKPDAEYLARLLQRPRELVELGLLMHGPARGREGFFS